MNKKLILRFRVVDKDNFLEVKNGLKVVETRAAAPKYRQIKKGDTLVIVCGKDRMEKKVKRVRIFPSIGAMVKVIPYKRIMPSIKSLSDLQQVYYGYPGYRDKLKKYGVIAFDI
jgi:ASC-1-like (ASCH) protein